MARHSIWARAKIGLGWSDPTFDGFQPPKVLWGRSSPSPRNGDRVLPACIHRCNQR